MPITWSLPREELEALEYAGILHDIGKVGIVDSILGKPERLTAKEWGKMLSLSVAPSVTLL